MKWLKKNWFFLIVVVSGLFDITRDWRLGTLSSFTGVVIIVATVLCLLALGLQICGPREV